MSSEPRIASKKRVLNTGSGPSNPNKLHPAFRDRNWLEVRLDIDARVTPDFVGSVTEMRSFAPDATFDAVWSSHNVEHLHTHEVVPAFREFHRILRSDGFALITCPDLQAIAALVVDGKAETPVYTSPAGPITPLDMLYGHASSIAQGNNYMSHNTGFTAERLGRVLLEAGFAEVRICKGSFHDLWALGLMSNSNVEILRKQFIETEQCILTN